MNVPPPTGDDWKVWARRLAASLERGALILPYRTGGSSAAEDGVLLWDRALACPVVSLGGDFVPLLMFVAAPSAASDPGEAGQVAWDTDYVYVCTAADTWKRAALSTW